MSLVDKLIGYRTSRVSVIHQYRLLATPGCLDLFFFVEGSEDVIFFGTMLRKISQKPLKVRYLVCDGKDGVLNVRTELETEDQSGCSKLYFIDKDIDDFFGQHPPTGNDVFCTEHYSIENYLVTESVLETILQEFFGLSDSDTVKDEIVGHYRREYRAFCFTMRVFMAWVIFRRQNSQRIILADIAMNKLFRIDDELKFRKRAGAFQLIRQRYFVGDTQKEWIEVRRICEELKVLETKSYLRGKFELWFFFLSF